MGIKENWEFIARILVKKGNPLTNNMTSPLPSSSSPLITSTHNNNNNNINALASFGPAPQKLKTMTTDQPPLYKVGVMEMLKNKEILENLTAIEEGYLVSGTYYLIGLEEQKNIKDYNYLKYRVYLLNPKTNHVECVSLEDNLYKLFKEKHLAEQIKYTSLMPEILIDASFMYNFVNLKYPHLLEKTDYKDFNAWEVQSCYPFAGCRLVKTEMKANDRDDKKLMAKYRGAGNIEQCPNKWAMFSRNGIRYMEEIGDTFEKYKKVYIVGHTNCWWGNCKSFILVVEHPEDVYKLRLYNDEKKVKQLLRVLDAKPATGGGCSNNNSSSSTIVFEGGSSYNEILYGDYVIEMELADKKRRLSHRINSRKIIKLEEAPFYIQKID